MRIHLIAVGTRMPDWVTRGYEEYARRMPRTCSLRLVEIPPGDRHKSRTTEQAREQEGQRMLAAIPRDCQVIALDVTGRSCSTADLAGQLAGWLESGRDTVLLVGGPDGLAPACLDRVFILFPDPWPKKRHHKRRVLQAESLDRLAELMRPGAELRLASDEHGYVDWMMALLHRHPAFDWLAECAADWRSRPADWPATRYEDKAIAAGRKPTYMRFRRTVRPAS